MKRIRIDHDLWSKLLALPGVEFHGGYSDPSGDCGQPIVTTGHGIKGVGKILEATTKWDRGSGTFENPKRVNETHEYWLLLRSENE